MFDNVPPNKKKIFVTGPQRSGTRITAHILANHLGFDYIDENQINLHHHWRKLIIEKNNFVLQCPQHACRCHRFTFHNDVLIIFCRRDINEIINSQKRIKWGAEKTEKNKYLDKFSSYFDLNPNLIKKPISTIKYYIWDHLQKMVLSKHFWYESDFNLLKKSPLWIDKNNRKNFKYDQWRKQND